MKIDITRERPLGRNSSEKFVFLLVIPLSSCSIYTAALSVSLCLSLSVCLSVCLSVSLSVCLSLCLSIYLSIYLSISIYLYIYIYIYNLCIHFMHSFVLCKCFLTLEGSIDSPALSIPSKHLEIIGKTLL